MMLLFNKSILDDNRLSLAAKVAIDQNILIIRWLVGLIEIGTPESKKPRFTGLSGCFEKSSYFFLVPWAGLEPAQHSPLRPQHSVSTNSTTGALKLLNYFCSSVASAGAASFCTAGTSDAGASAGTSAGTSLVAGTSAGAACCTAGTTKPCDATLE
jgi:hypothetical protein